MNILKRFIASQSSLRVLSFTSRNHARYTSKTPVTATSSDMRFEEENTEPRSKMNLHMPDMPIQETIKQKWRYQVETAIATAGEVEVVERPAKEKPKKRPQPKSQKIDKTDMLETVLTEDGKFIYTKLSNNDPRVGRLLTTIKSRKERETRDLILLEGKRLICDALYAGCDLRYLLFARHSDVDAIKLDLPSHGAKLYKMPYKEIQMWSDLTTAPGLMGLFRTPDTEKYIATDTIPLTIYCDNVREPGNLGAILRVAAAVGSKRVLLSTGCTSMWDTKVTRSSAGSHFRVQILNKQGVADLRELLADTSVQRQLFIADNNVVYKTVKTTKSGSENAEDLSAVINQIPIVPYYSIDVRDMLAGREMLLVIGGETEGVSSSIFQLAKDHNGTRLNIPLQNNIDSLNSGTALGVIVFEIYRQLQTAKGGNSQ